MAKNIRREYVNLCNGCCVAWKGYICGTKAVLVIFGMEFLCV